MICVRLIGVSADRHFTWLPEETPAVAGSRYRHLDEGQCGIVRHEIATADVTTLKALRDAGEADVFVESEEPDDVLDDFDEVATHIWWHVVFDAPPT